VYVLSGSVNMQVKGGELKTLLAGETFYETPEDIHTVDSNASGTAPAKLLVFFVKKLGEPTKVAVE
jgi:quercetin dioxygenase-like cupin family protein